MTLFVLSAAIAVLLSDRVGFRRDDDALSRLALVATFLGLVLIVAYPMYTAYARNLETRADRRRSPPTGDRAATVRAMVRYADDDLVAALRPPFDPLVLRRPAGARRAHRGDGGNAPTRVPGGGDPRRRLNVQPSSVRARRRAK